MSNITNSAKGGMDFYTCAGTPIATGTSNQPTPLGAALNLASNTLMNSVPRVATQNINTDTKQSLDAKSAPSTTPATYFAIKRANNQTQLMTSNITNKIGKDFIITSPASFVGTYPIVEIESMSDSYTYSQTAGANVDMTEGPATCISGVPYSALHDGIAYNGTKFHLSGNVDKSQLATTFSGVHCIFTNASSGVVNDIGFVYLGTGGNITDGGSSWTFVNGSGYILTTLTHPGGNPKITSAQMISVNTYYATGQGLIVNNLPITASTYYNTSGTTIGGVVGGPDASLIEFNRQPTPNEVTVINGGGLRTNHLQGVVQSTILGAINSNVPKSDIHPFVPSVEIRINTAIASGQYNPLTNTWTTEPVNSTNKSVYDTAGAAATQSTDVEATPTTSIPFGEFTYKLGQPRPSNIDYAKR